MRFKRSLVKTAIWAVGVTFLVVMVAALYGMMAAHDTRTHFLLRKLNDREIELEQNNDTRNNENKQALMKDVEINGSHLVHTIDRLYEKSREVTHLGFLKIHKAASTTTQAIFLRFGWRRNLTFVLPPDFNAFGYPNIISTNESITKYNILPPPPGKQFDILCNHVVYGKEAWASILPKDALSIGTVREPFRLFKSMLNYFNPRTVSNLETMSSEPLKVYIENPLKFEPKNLRYSFLNNRLAFEYGVHPDIITQRDFQAFDDYLKNVLDKQFKVVILAERFDESLVLLKRRLSWSLNDIMYAMKNVRNVKKPDRYDVKEEYRTLHRQFSIFDYLLYEFFEARHINEIANEGPSFEEEVEHFKSSRTKVETFCHGAKKNIVSITVAKTEFNEEFVITKDDCTIMHKGEIAFTQMIRVNQYGKAEWQPRARA